MGAADGTPLQTSVLWWELGEDAGLGSRTSRVTSSTGFHSCFGGLTPPLSGEVLLLPSGDTHAHTLCWGAPGCAV